MKLRATVWNEEVAPGTIVEYRSVSENELNYFAHGINCEPVPGIFANYLTLPKYAWRQVECTHTTYPNTF